MDWYRHKVTQGTVLYLVAEGVGGFRKRVRAWEQHNGRTMKNVHFMTSPVQVMGDEWRVLREVCRKLRPALIVLDTQSRITVSVEETQPKRWARSSTGSKSCAPTQARACSLSTTRPRAGKVAAARARSRAR